MIMEIKFGGGVSHLLLFIKNKRNINYFIFFYTTYLIVNFIIKVTTNKCIITYLQIVKFISIRTVRAREQKIIFAI